MIDRPQGDAKNERRPCASCGELAPEWVDREVAQHVGHATAMHDCESREWEVVILTIPGQGCRWAH